MSIKDRMREERARKSAAEQAYTERQEFGIPTAGMTGGGRGIQGACETSRLSARELLKAKANDWERRAQGLRALAEALPTSGLSEVVEAQIFEVVSLLTSR